LPRIAGQQRYNDLYLAVSLTMKSVFCFTGKSIIVTGLVQALLWPLLSVAGDIGKDDIYLATREGKEYRRSRDHKFGCDDTIYLFIRSSDNAFADKTLETTWQNSSTGAKHNTSKGFAARRSNPGLWSWSGIVFTSGDGGALGKMMGFLDPAAGREAFIGTWTIRAQVEGLLDQTLTMEVLC